MTSMKVYNRNVTYQFNITGGLNIGAVNNRQEAVVQIERLADEIRKAAESGAIPDEAAVEARYNADKAFLLAQKPDADKKGILEHLDRAKTFVENVAATGGLVAAIIEAGKMVQKWF